MDYFELMSEICTPSVAAEVRIMDLASIAAEDRLIELLRRPKTPESCKSAILAYLADRLNTASSSTVVYIYFEQAARLAFLHSTETVSQIRKAATSIRIQHYPVAARDYFGALILNNIDIRPYLSETLVPDWNFKIPKAVTWQYYLYLADFKTPGALEALAKKIAETPNGNDATHFLVSLTSLKSTGAKKILEQYIGDQRTADGPDGPGLTINKTVSIYLDAINWQ